MIFERHLVRFVLQWWFLRTMNFHIHTQQQLYLIELVGFLINRARFTRAIALDISKASDSVWQVNLLCKDKPQRISILIFGFALLILSSRQFRMVVDGKPLQKYPVTANATQSSILGPSSFLIYINDFRDYTICNIANYADNTILYSK